MIGGIWEMKKTVIISATILIAAIFIFSGLYMNFSNNRYKVVGNKMFDTMKGVYVEYIPPTPTPTISPTPRPTLAPTPTPTVPPKKDPGDITKVVVTGDSFKNSSGYFTLLFSVQNNDSVSHMAYAKVILYNKSSQPIITETFILGNLSPGQLVSKSYSGSNGDLVGTYEIKISDSR